MSLKDDQRPGRPFFIGIGELAWFIMTQKFDVENLDGRKYCDVHEDLRLDDVISDKHESTVILIAGNQPMGQAFHRWLLKWRKALSYSSVVIVGFSDDSRRREVLSDSGCDLVCSSYEIDCNFLEDLYTLQVGRVWLRVAEGSFTDGITDGVDITERRSESESMLQLYDSWKDRYFKFAEQFKDLADRMYPHRT